jgi:hypothetical protein
MANNQLIQPRQRNYLAKDYENIYRDLLEISKIYYGDKIQDLTENSLGGMLLEWVARVSDVHSYYLDYQFKETNPEKSVESKNIQSHLKNAGIEVFGAAPAIVYQTFYIEVPADTNSQIRVPLESALPTIQAGTIVRSNSGVLFELVEDLSFSEKYSDGKLIAKQEVLEKDINNNPISFILTREGLCISSQTYTENITINSFEKFKKITLSKENINQILSVVDNEGTEYYEVKYLTQDTVFKAIPNLNYDNKTVKNILQIIPAPYRFIKEMNIDTRLMTLTFGGGNANSLLDDIIPDPSDFALPLYGKTTFPKFDINPSKFLETNTLGLLKPNTTLTITYRYGGGLSHNIEARSTDSVETLKMNFPSSISQNIALQIRNSVDVQNLKKAIGGDDAPTVEKLKLLIPISKNNQNRIVTEQDALTAIYKLPANFGRVHRAAIRKNENNLFSSTIYLICKDNNNYLTIASDNLKRNVSLYLNEYRLISDSFDILDAQIINFQLLYSVILNSNFGNKQLIMQNINFKLKEYFDKKVFEIDEPIFLDEIRKLIYSIDGVLSINNIIINNISGIQDNNRIYNNGSNLDNITYSNIIQGPIGSIFEMKYKQYDIIGSYI